MCTLNNLNCSKYIYLSPLGNLTNNNFIGLSGQSNNVNFCQILLPINCNIKSLSVKLNVAPTGSRTFTIVKNSVNTIHVLTISGANLSGKLTNINLNCAEFDTISILNSNVGAGNSSGSLTLEYSY